MDSVLIEHNYQHIQEVNERFGTSFTPEDIKDFEYGFLTPEQRDHVYACWCRTTLYDDDRLDGQVLWAVEQMRTFARVLVCSSPMLGHIRSKYEFLLKYFDRRDIFLCSDKYLLHGDILVDDAPHNILDFRATGRHAIVFDRPWNRRLEGSRAYNFDDVLIQTHAYIEATRYARSK